MANKIVWPVIAVLVLAVSACSFFKKPGCFIQEQIVTVATDAVASTLECSGREAIRTDLTEVVSKVGLCSQAPTGNIADAVCPMAVGAILQFVSDKAIPQTWECKATNARAFLSEKLTDACKKIPVSAGK